MRSGSGGGGGGGAGTRRLYGPTTDGLMTRKTRLDSWSNPVKRLNRAANETAEGSNSHEAHRRAAENLAVKPRTARTWQFRLHPQKLSFRRAFRQCDRN